MRTGLLIIDLQTGFSPSADLVSAIAAECHQHDVVVATQFENPPDSLYRKVLDWHGDGGELVLPLPAGTPVLRKTGYGLSADHLEVLAALRCQEWHLCGLETDACVLACAFSLWDAGIRPVIRGELCASPLHSQGMAVAVRQFGEAF